MGHDFGADYDRLDYLEEYVEQLRRDKVAILRMLIARATLMDRWRAWRHSGHWLHKAKRESIIRA